MNKIELYNAIKNLQHNFIIGHAALLLLESPDMRKELDGFYLVFGEERRSFNQVYADSNALDMALSEFVRASTRSIIRETWEIIWAYCKKEEALTKLIKREFWFHYFRIIRDALSHNYKIKINPRDEKLLPIRWNGLEITKDMDGKEILFQDEIGEYNNIWKFLLEVETFVLTKVN